MDEVLFCPFCGEAFEGETHCPEHELALLPWSQLPRPKEPVNDAAQLAWYSPRYGRGLVAGAALCVLLGFVALPLGHVSGAVPMGGSMLRLSLHGAPRLWLVPAAAGAALLILYRRRSPRAMRAARLALLLVGCIPLIAVLWTWFGARAAVAVLARSLASDLRLELGAGAYLVVAATPVLVFGSLRLGLLGITAKREAGGYGRNDSGR